MKLITIIPARGGSKGIPHKNITPLCGKPLITWTIEAALASGFVERCIVSTDDEQIAAIAKKAGADVPFLRPEELSRDDTPGIDPVLHAVQWMDANEGYKPEYVMLLQPTSPLRTVRDIKAVIDLAEVYDADSVISVCEVSHHPYWTMRLNEDGTVDNFLDMNLESLSEKYPRRQNLMPAYSENGAIYLVRRSVLLERRSFYGKRIYGYVMPNERSLDIDTAWDLHLAELILNDRGQNERD